MITTEQKLRKRLESHRAVSYLYENDGQAGLIQIWFYAGHFDLSWEECKDGDQYNEDSYTRDEILHFPDVDAVFTFLRDNDLEIARFRW